MISPLLDSPSWKAKTDSIWYYWLPETCSLTEQAGVQFVLNSERTMIRLIVFTSCVVICCIAQLSNAADTKGRLNVVIIYADDK